MVIGAVNSGGMVKAGRVGTVTSDCCRCGAGLGDWSGSLAGGAASER
jgi:hypothetical protein